MTREKESFYYASSLLPLLPVKQMWGKAVITDCRGIRNTDMDSCFKEDITQMQMVQHTTLNNNRQRIELNQEYKYTHGK